MPPPLIAPTKQAGPPPSGPPPNASTSASVPPPSSPLTAGTVSRSAMAPPPTTAPHQQNTSPTGSPLAGGSSAPQSQSQFFSAPSQQQAYRQVQSSLMNSFSRSASPTSGSSSFEFSMLFAGSDVETVAHFLSYSDVHSEALRQLALVFATPLARYPTSVELMNISIVEVGNGHLTVEGNVTLQTQSKPIRRDAIAAFSQFLGSGSQVLQALSYVFGAAASSSSPISRFSRPTSVQLAGLNLSKSYINDVLVFPYSKHSINPTGRLMAPSRADIVYGEIGRAHV